jgi:hypothetical protein
MRRSTNLLIPLLVVALASWALAYDRGRRQLEQTYELTRFDLANLRAQAAYRGALHEVAVTRAGFARQIKKDWFAGESIPHNRLIRQQQRWLDIAVPGDLFEHPPDPIAYRTEQAGFWYNPNLGIVRARVPWQHSNGLALEAYNRVNGTDLEQLPGNRNQRARARRSGDSEQATKRRRDAGRRAWTPRFRPDP